MDEFKFENDVVNIFSKEFQFFLSKYIANIEELIAKRFEDDDYPKSALLIK